MSIKILETIVTPIELKDAPIGIVKGVQEALGVSIDGIIGAYTLTAFYAFKKQHSLGEPNTLGATTAKKLLENLARKPLKTKSDHIRLIITEAKKQGLNSRQHLCYILATVEHETAYTFKPISEYGGSKTRYAPYYGRGYVQLTWEYNYRKYQVLTGKQLVKHPDLAKEPYTAAFILIHGFRTGTFTGKRISDYITNKKCDYVNARRCINGTDKSHQIAALANQWQTKISEYI